MRTVANPAYLEDIQSAIASAPGLLRDLGIDAEELGSAEIGSGYYARVFRLPSGLVLKLTTDRDDAEASALIRDAGSVQGLIHVREVWRIPETVPGVDDGRRLAYREPLYAIISEPVVPVTKLARWEAVTAVHALDSLVQSYGSNLPEEVSEHPSIEAFIDQQEVLPRYTSKEERHQALRYLENVITGWSWLSEHGFDVEDLHAGNFGIAAGDRMVMFDFGHLSGREAADVDIPLAANPSQMPKTERVFDEAFDEVERRFPGVGTIELHSERAAGSDNGAGSERQFAFCKDGDPIIIAFAPKAEALSVSQLRGLMRHEFGHALEYRYGVAALEKQLDKLPAEVERRADAIAEAVWGEPIRYDSKNIQCLGRGKSPRPAHLPDAKEKLKANAGAVPSWLLSPSEAVRWAQEHLSETVHDLQFEEDLVERSEEYSAFAREAATRKLLTIYRAFDRPLNEIDFERLGRSWSAHLAAADCYGGGGGRGWGERGDCQTVIEATVAVRDIDWPYSFESFLMYGEGQFEVAPRPGSPVTITAYYRGPRRTGFDRTPLNVSGNIGDTKEEWAPPPGKTFTAAFRRWFGDSQVVDENGLPLVVYHGSPFKFSSFDPSRARNGSLGTGFYFTPDYVLASEYGEPLPFHLSIQNPFVIDAGTSRGAALLNDGRNLWARLRSANARQRLESEGFDGVVVRDDGQLIEVVSFYPSQIAAVAGLAENALANSGAGVLPNPPPGKTFTAYHATTRAFDRPTDFKEFRSQDFGPGFYLGTEPADLRSYGSRLYEAKVRLENPIVISPGAPVDPELVRWLQRVLKIDDDQLGFYDSKLVGIFDLLKMLVEMEEIDPRKLIAALQKKGYDGIYIDGSVVGTHHTDMPTPQGDYLVIWSPEQLLSWEETERLEANSGAIGECYPFASRLAVEHHGDPNVRIAHGTVNDRFSGASYPHAWVEKHGRAYDWQTRATKPDGIDLDTYYDIYRPSDVTFYTPTEAVRACFSEGHHGPWESR